MKKKETKKVLKLSAETICQLESKEAVVVGYVPATPASGVGCCP